MPMIVKGYAWVTFQFQILQGLYNLSLGTTFVLNYYNYVESPQWLIITSIAGAITTAMIVVSGIRHGLFKTY
jgi:hypothetical protein